MGLQMGFYLLPNHSFFTFALLELHKVGNKEKQKRNKGKTKKPFVSYTFASLGMPLMERGYL